MNPFAVSAARLYRFGHEARPNVTVLVGRVDRRVEQEEVDAPVPCDVHEADEAVAVMCGDPGEGAFEDTLVIALALSVPGVHEERRQHRWVDCRPPREDDAHSRSVARDRLSRLQPFRRVSHKAGTEGLHNVGVG